MANLFIAYDLMAPGKNYDAVRTAIESLGPSYRFQFSLFFVHTPLSPVDAYNRVMVTMDTNDKLAVIDASGGVVTTWDRPPIAEIKAIWNQPTRPANLLMASLLG